MKTPKYKPMIGKKFGRLIVVAREGVTKDRLATWRCKCDCGNETIVDGKSLRTGHTRSCGCLLREAAAIKGKNNRKHGQSNSPTYSSWRAMKERCNNKNSKAYKWYGARGIKVCDRWNESFSNFIHDMGEKKDTESLDRIDCDGNYEPSNCRWTTMKVQQNNRRNNRLVTINGKTKTIALWCDELGVSPPMVYARVEHGWNGKDALLTGRMRVNQ